MEKYFAGTEHFPGTEALPVPRPPQRMPQVLPKKAQKELERAEEEAAVARVKYMRYALLERIAGMAASEISGQTLIEMASNIDRANRIKETATTASDEQKARLDKELMTQLDWLGEYADLARSAIAQELYSHYDDRGFLEKWLWNHST
jgi:hypothetical protein